MKLTDISNASSAEDGIAASRTALAAAKLLRTKDSPVTPAAVAPLGGPRRVPRRARRPEGSR